MAVSGDGEEDPRRLETLMNPFLHEVLSQPGLGVDTGKLYYSESALVLLIEALAWHHACFNSLFALHCIVCCLFYICISLAAVCAWLCLVYNRGQAWTLFAYSKSFRY